MDPHVPPTNTSGSTLEDRYPQRPQWQNLHTIGTWTQVKVLRGLCLHLHRRQTCRISFTQEPLHLRVPSPHNVCHVVAAVNEHYSNGVAEHAVHTIRTTAKAMLLHANIPKKFWCYAVSHATYLNSMTHPSRADRSKTIYEMLFRKKPDVIRVPPYGAFTCIYKECRDLKDQNKRTYLTQGSYQTTRTNLTSIRNSPPPHPSRQATQTTSNLNQTQAPTATKNLSYRLRQSWHYRQHVPHVFVEPLSPSNHTHDSPPTIDTTTTKASV